MRKMLILAAALTLALATAASAADKAAPKATPDPGEERVSPAVGRVQAIVQKIQEKMARGGEPREAEFADELKALDALGAELKASKDPYAPLPLLLKSAFYAQVLKEVPKSREILAGIRRDFPETPWALQSWVLEARILADAGDAAGLEALIKNYSAGKPDPQVVEVLQALAAQARLAVGRPFPPFAVKDTNGKALTLAGLKGKVVLIDFWASWCGPCRAEMPNVVKIYAKYQPQGFEIVGINLDQERQAMDDFIKQMGMTWPQYYDGKGWECELARKYGIDSIPQTFLLDRQGIIIGVGLRGEELDRAVAAALKPQEKAPAPPPAK